MTRDSAEQDRDRHAQHDLMRWPHFPASSMTCEGCISRCITAGQDSRVFIRENAAEWAREDGYANS